MKLRRLLAAAVLAAAPTARAAPLEPPGSVPPAGDPRVVTIPRLDGAVRIDGVLDEPAWEQAALLDGFHQFQPVDGRPAEERTEVRVFYTASAIFFGVRAYDSQPATVHATVADRDNLSADDTVTIYLDTFNDHRRAFFFTVNPLGAQADGVRTEGTTNPSEIDGGDVDGNPDFVFESRGHLTREGWEVELRVPFKSLRYPSGAGPHTWGLNVERRVGRTGYVDTWSDVRRGSTSFLAQSGLMVGLHDLQRGAVFEAQPFVTVAADGLRQRDGSFLRAPAETDVGVNLRLGLSPDTSLDAAVNPDYSQVESDAGQISINERFAFYYPEKRPFFLESSDLFATPNRLIYTRRVINPSFGAKLTLKRGGFNLAHLTAVDENSFASGPDAFLSATRVRRDLGRDSIAGLTFTHRRQGDTRNTVLAGDGRWVFGKLYFIRAQGGGSWTNPGEGAPMLRGPVWLAEVDRTGRTWGFNYKVNAIGRDFDAQAGFVPRSDVVEGSATNRISVYGARGSLAESLSVYHSFTRRWPYLGFRLGAPVEEENTLLALLRLRGGWQLWAQAFRKFYGFDAVDYEFYSTLTPDGEQPFTPQNIDNAWDFLARVDLPTFRRIDGNAQVRTGAVAIFPEASRGHETRWEATFNLRPTSSLRVGASLVVSYLRRQLDGSEFARSVLPRFRLEYQPTRALFFRLVSEYVSERTSSLRHPTTGEPLLIFGSPQRATRSGRLRYDALISFEPRPGTAVFAGYGSLLNDKRGAGLSDLARLTDGFFFKVTYRFRN